jgi:hypothetical protein
MVSNILQIFVGLGLLVGVCGFLSDILEKVMVWDTLRGTWVVMHDLGLIRSVIRDR